MPYVEFHLNWTGITAQEQAAQVRSRTVDDYYWRYNGSDGLLFSALYYPSALEICRYNFGRNLLDFAGEETIFRLAGPLLQAFINFAYNCQAIVSEGHLRDGDWLIPFQNNDSAVLRLDQWRRAIPALETPPLPYNIGLYNFVGDTSAKLTANETPDWIKIVRDFMREQAAFAKLAEQKLQQGLEVFISLQTD